MKSLAAVNIRQFMRAAQSAEEYARAVESGLQIVLRSMSEGAIPSADERDNGQVGVVVYGSAHGLCGQFNRQIVTYALETLTDLGIAAVSRSLMVMGDRVTGRLEESGQAIERRFPITGSLPDVAPMLQQALITMDEWRGEKGIRSILVFYNSPRSQASYEPTYRRLLPLDSRFLLELRERKWPSRGLPTFSMDSADLLSSLIRQFLFITLHKAFVESLASENAARLSAMQAAEKNVEERLEELNSAYHSQRQEAVTNELFDIVAGFEALTAKQR
jgi:F-type H+-transporting ATPase subunit gamma